jgi:teichuronic acid biosynthesis glycosyltransferase TuaG
VSGTPVNVSANAGMTKVSAVAGTAKVSAVAGTAKVSVIMPAYNAAATLQASMDSVFAQTHADVELLVIDDRSKDATWTIIEDAAAREPRLVPIRMPQNGGVAAARNAGLEAATGSHIAFLDSDDRWLPDKLALQLAHLQATGGAIGYTAYRRFGEDGRTLSVVRPPAAVGYADMLKSNRIGNLTGLYDRALGEARFQRIGHEDYVFWLQLVRRAGIARRVPTTEPLAEYLVRSGSLSADKTRAARWQWNIYRNVEGLGRLRSAWYFAHYAAIAVAKRR